MYAIFLQDCIKKMCIWKKHSDLDTHDRIYTIGGAINPSFEPHPTYEMSLRPQRSRETNPEKI